MMGGVTRSTSQESSDGGGEEGKEGGMEGGQGKNISVLGGGDTQAVGVSVGSGKEGGREGGLASIKPSATAQQQVSNGSKLRLRFFSEPHGSCSEMGSEEEGGGEDGGEGGGEDGWFLEGVEEEGGRGGGSGQGGKEGGMEAGALGVC